MEPARAVRREAAGFRCSARGCIPRQFWMWYGISRKIVADFVCSTEDAIIRPRDCVHERRVITHNRTGKAIDSRHNGDLATMRLEIAIVNKLARADSRAVDHEIEF